MQHHIIKSLADDVVLCYLKKNSPLRNGDSPLFQSIFSCAIFNKNMMGRIFFVSLQISFFEKMLC